MLKKLGVRRVRIFVVRLDKVSRHDANDTAYRAVAMQKRGELHRKERAYGISTAIDMSAEPKV